MTKAHPITNAVCDALDLTVMTDIIDRDEETFTNKVGYAIGAPGERGAGLIQFTVTPWFPTMDELKEYVIAHHQKVIGLLASGSDDIPSGYLEEWGS